MESVAREAGNIFQSKLTQRWISNLTSPSQLGANSPHFTSIEEKNADICHEGSHASQCKSLPQVDMHI